MQKLFASVNLVELGALLTAVFALVATLWQASMTRKHNRLSVRPVLTLYRREPDGIIELKNNGFGPAIIQTCEIFQAGKPVDSESMTGLLPVEFVAPEVKAGAAIAAGATLVLIEAITRLLADHIEPMEALKFRVVYQSIYGDEWVLE